MNIGELTPEPSRSIEPRFEVGTVLVVSALATPALIGYGVVKHVERSISESKTMRKVVYKANMFIDGTVNALKVGSPKRYQ